LGSFGIVVVPANIQDGDCGQPDPQDALSVSTDCKTHCRCGYAGAKLKAALGRQPVELEIVKRIDKESGFKVVRRRIKDWE
jgi:hypothetical protein